MITKIYLQNTNQADKRHIKQALLLKSQRDAKRKGWKQIGRGIHKVTYKKGRIVVKFAKWGRNSHLEAEVKKYFSIPKYYRRYFARIFGGNSNKIIQRYVPIKLKSSYSKQEFIRFNKITNKFKVWDVSLYHNITIINGSPVIYDFGCSHNEI